MPVPSLEKFGNSCIHFTASVDTTQLKIQSTNMELQKNGFFLSGNCYSSKHFLVAQTISCLVFSLRGGQRSMMLTSLCMFAFQVHWFLIFLKYTDMRILRQDLHTVRKEQRILIFPRPENMKTYWYPCSPCPEYPKPFHTKPKEFIFSSWSFCKVEVNSVIAAKKL